ncbi:hypothetical protein ACVWWD_003096 [Mesorhizobium sp. URHB0026]|nr:hypothetical protein X739_09460 [Mesorhizobium sp. LNHC220B00]ESY95074.1 hypothetical protein X741_09010 [Mesorhizobium sp. LNHC229A00]ESY98613.1 hypothetical protein X738_13510 [Mesorhizobium sp. LNHC209A00]
MNYFRQVSAAPHLPAGILSPCREGERGAGRDLRALLATSMIGEIFDDSFLLPVTIRGEVPGRAMRGGATLPHEGQAS